MNHTNKKPVKKNQYVDENPIEALKNFGGGIVDSFTQDVVKDSMSDFWDQLLGASEHENQDNHHGGDLQEGQELDLTKKEKKSEHKDAEPGIDYHREIVHGERRISAEKQHELTQEIQAILAELQRIVASSKVIEAEFKDVAIEQRITKPGKYHESFFAFILNLVKTARIRIEDSGAWLAQFNSKKGEKQYWSMFKKHGTSFGMSNERSVATQVG